MVLGRLATRSRLKSWGLILDDACPLCLGAGEDTAHLFFSCPATGAVWKGVLAWIHVHRQIHSFEAEVQLATQACRRKNAASKLYGVCFAETVYAVWCSRNTQVFDNKSSKSVLG